MTVEEKEGIRWKPCSGFQWTWFKTVTCLPHSYILLVYMSHLFVACLVNFRLTVFISYELSVTSSHPMNQNWKTTIITFFFKAISRIDKKAYLNSPCFNIRLLLPYQLMHTGIKIRSSWKKRALLTLSYNFWVMS